MKATTFPDWLVPMAATLTQDRFIGPEWIFERKFDGIRLIAFKNGSEVRLFSRNRLPLNASYPAVVEAIARLPVHDAILDGEAFGGFERLGTADYYVFDILRLDGRDLTSLTLDERRAILDGLPLSHPLERVVPLDDPRPWERARAEGWEGVIAKRRDSTYEHRRSKSWLKMKCEETHAFVVGGFTDPQGKRVGLGAVLVGYYDGDDFCFAGKIGTGFDTALLLELRGRLDGLEIAKPPFTKGKGLPRLRAHWVRPEIVIEAGFIEWTGHGKLRHPRLLRVVDSTPARAVRLRPGSGERSGNAGSNA
jgi:bifunctional non-homologous end joining protein LigD